MKTKETNPTIPGSPTPCKQALRRFWKFHVVVVQNNGKEMYRKIVLHLQRCIFANYTNCCFFTVLRRCLRRLALHHFIFGLNYKYYRALRFLPWLNLYIIQVIQLCLGKRQYLPVIDQLCGSGLIIFIRGGSAPRSNALTFHYHIYYF